ncbi:MAG TPA: DUF1003 domain-containing protein [Pyrinomonadaceae bacterium]|nr:DUF1003 domain-containing protein [Pyrinomonadaceae bacterium]
MQGRREKNSPVKDKRRNGNASQSEIIRKNISAIAEVQEEDEKSRTLSARLSDTVTRFSGSMLFVWLHAIWFGIWVVLNVGLVHIPRVSEFDPFPFGLLTMIVSLEAIFLSTFVLISQNRMAMMSERRAELDLHVNLLAEQKATKALEMLDLITAQLNQLNRFDLPHDPEIAALKVSPEPQEVLQVLRETVEEQAGEVKEEVKEQVKKGVNEAVEEITGEMEAVREDVEQTEGAVRNKVAHIEEKVEAVASDVEEIKERTGSHEKALVE